MPSRLAMHPYVRGLLEVTRSVRSDADLPGVFASIAELISQALGFRTVVINVHRRACDDYQVVTVYGSDHARAALLGKTTRFELWRPYLDERFHRHGTYLVPHEEVDWHDPELHVPDYVPRDVPNAWQPEDALIVPLAAADGRLLGFVSVDEPISGLRPDDEGLLSLAAFSFHVANAIESMQAAADAARDRESLAQLLEVSSSLNELAVDEMLDATAEAIRQALRFDKVVVAIGDAAGRFVPRGVVGFAPDAPALDFAYDRKTVDALLDPAFEVGGCYLLPWEEGVARAPNAVTYESTRNGRGPHAWNRHWLLVPLVARDGSLSGFVWADDPDDSLLPSPERLDVLRTFANQAGAALDSALGYEALSRRSGELAALHATTIALLDRLDVESVLAAIVDQARELIGTEHAFLSLVDEEAEVLRFAVQRGAFERESDYRLRRGEGIAGRVWDARESVVVADYLEWEGRLPQLLDLGLRAVLGVPLRSRADVRGVLGVAFDEEGRTFSSSEIALLERFAQLASLALENASLYDAAQREIEERLNAEEALRRSRELYRKVVETSADVIMLVDLQGRIVFASPSSERVLGLPVHEIVGSSYGQHVHLDDAADAAEVIGRALAGEAAQSYAVRVRHRDGHWVSVEGVANVVRDDDGRPEFILSVARDVTERERLQEQLRQAQKMESVGQLAGGIAHDFNNLLTAIGGYAELTLLECAEDATATENLEQIVRASRQASELTAQLLAFSRKQVLHPRVLDLNEVIGQMTTMVARMLGEHVILSSELDPDLGPTLADPVQMEQVVLNLAINARDAMPDGGNLYIKTGMLEVAEGEPPPHPTLEPGSYVTVTVRDTGGGMGPEVATRIFEPFFTTKGIGEGTGLGLATVHGIVTQTGGAVWVETAPGAGACFTVCLPCVREPACVPAPPQHAIHART